MFITYRVKASQGSKEPWRRSSGYLALGQMLVTNQRLDKLALFRAQKFAAGLPDKPLLPSDVIAVDPDSTFDDNPDEENCQDDGDLEDAIADDQDAEIIIQLAKTPGFY